MNRDSSASDWDMIPDVEITSMPRAGSAFQDEDFFSSGQFQPVPLDRIAPQPAAALPPPAVPPVSNIDPTRSLQPKQRASSTPATPSTGGGVSQFPPQLTLDDVDGGTFRQGFPSTTSVDSMFNAAGGFTHFSPQKDQKVLSSGYREMHPSHSSSSMIATPTSPPPGNVSQEGLVDSCRAVVFPSLSAEAGTPVSSRLSNAAAAASSFRPPLVPKLQLQSFPSPSVSAAAMSSPLKARQAKSSNGNLAASLFSCITPRVPAFLRSASEGCPKQFLSEEQHATLRWEEPLQAFVRWTMAMLTLDVLHTFTSESNTWTALLARGIVLLMVCGRLFRTSQDQQGVVSSEMFGQRLQSYTTMRSDRWAESVGEASYRLLRVVVLDTPPMSRSTIPGPSRNEGSPTWIDGFHAACRVALVCGGIDVILCQSPFGAGRMLDVAIFWMSFASLRVPFRIALSDLLFKFDGVKHLRRSWIGAEGMKYVVKTTSGEAASNQTVIRKGVADVACWCGLQALFALCKVLQPSFHV